MVQQVRINVGDKVKDTLSELEGRVIARTEWIYGCVRVTIQPFGSKDGKPFDTLSIDEPQAELLEPAETVPPLANDIRPTTMARTHGARDDASALRR